LARADRHLVVVLGGEVIADSRGAWKVLETSHPPVYYFPPADINMEYLSPSPRSSFCEWKGQAHYFDVRVGDRLARAAGWYYPDPVKPFRPLRNHIAFFAGPMDRCTVDGEVVRPQPGGFYGGWITADLAGPFKGEPGTEGW
jgi:uncharacterized protein (DUF427 family)